MVGISHINKANNIIFKIFSLNTSLSNYKKITQGVLLTMVDFQEKMSLIIITLYLLKKLNILQKNMHVLIKFQNIKTIGISRIGAINIQFKIFLLIALQQL